MRTATPGRIEIALSGSIAGFPLDTRFSVPAKGVAAIFGPPGCGKTAVARCIAGLERLPAGFCAIDGEVWQDKTTFRPPHLRPIGYVSQEASLFPHLSVRRNLLYGAPKPKPTPIAFDEVLELLDLAPLLDRSPSHLSGGERQRVAMGRALLSQPRLLVMDEPLGALDSCAKREILPFVERLPEKLALPMIYIGHDMAEIERFADHLVMMERGMVTAAGPLHVLQTDPALPLAASREAAISLDAVVSGYDGRYGLLILRLKGAHLLVPAPPLAPGVHQRLRIAAYDVSVAREAPRAGSILNVFPARIRACLPLGAAEITLVLALGTGGLGTEILARITRFSFDSLGLKDGVDVFAQLKHVSLLSASEPPLQTIPASTPTADPGDRQATPRRETRSSAREASGIFLSLHSCRATHVT
ncbi:molybdenum ABC transporter ATP-binding protein [Bradyrhizobium sp. sBnM-33]|uniref:molybdenum ABC transporter ATP-binding protein n=1 Tax=Bradyrhizobium sp. sBnM-33 TaxID=2831780 RepID=UPI001BCC381D|nr:molybdenum ABC transporter ATP-binding protein [Bradyrhizobium sp. sBnM-33]WOH52388.1 molybdenum ABC transporter ATP-binding protein [Bradyrhizobium sp. sBnM-33]